MERVNYKRYIVKSMLPFLLSSFRRLVNRLPEPFESNNYPHAVDTHQQADRRRAQRKAPLTTYNDAELEDPFGNPRPLCV